MISDPPNHDLVHPMNQVKYVKGAIYGFELEETFLHKFVYTVITERPDLYKWYIIIFDLLQSCVALVYKHFFYQLRKIISLFISSKYEEMKIILFKKYN